MLKRFESHQDAASLLIVEDVVPPRAQYRSVEDGSLVRAPLHIVTQMGKLLRVITEEGARMIVKDGARVYMP